MRTFGKLWDSIDNTLIVGDRVPQGAAAAAKEKDECPWHDSIRRGIPIRIHIKKSRSWRYHHVLSYTLPWTINKKAVFTATHIQSPFAERDSVKRRRTTNWTGLRFLASAENKEPSSTLCYVLNWRWVATLALEWNGRLRIYIVNGPVVETVALGSSFIPGNQEEAANKKPSVHTKAMVMWHSDFMTRGGASSGLSLVCRLIWWCFVNMFSSL